MPIQIKWFMLLMGRALLALLTFAVATTEDTSAQQRDGLLSGNITYNSGQSIQPIFEGWTKTDRGYELWFGYLNRNHVEQLAVPVGPNNRIEPGAPDRGQPTYFYPRFNRQLFAVTVPADFGDKGQIIWTVVANGQTERAIGWLRPDWEIAPPSTGMGTSAGRGGADNRPPTLTLTGPAQVGAADTVTLIASVTDDGLPPARAARGRGGNAKRPPAFDNPEFKGAPPTNVPQLERPAPPRINARLQVSWSVWRGPADVAFSPPVAGADEGKAEFNARVSKPGEYVLRARATDGAAITVQEYRLTVAASQP